MHGWWSCVEDPNLFWNKIHRYWIPWADRIYSFTPMEPYQSKCYHLFTDNWYNSVWLTEYISKRNTYITDTLRADRKRNPSQVVGKKFRKGEMVFMSLCDISVTKLRDKRDVCVISNVHVPTMMDSVNRHGRSKGNQTLFISTTTICRESIDRIKCCRNTLHCEKV